MRFIDECGATERRRDSLSKLRDEQPKRFALRRREGEEGQKELPLRGCGGGVRRMEIASP